MTGVKETFLPQLAQSFEKIKDEQPVSTRGFAAACDRILPIFDHLGETKQQPCDSAGSRLGFLAYTSRMDIVHLIIAIVG